MALFFMEYSMHFNLTPRKTKTWQTVLYILSFLYLTVSTLLVLFLMERFIVNHTYWLLSIGLLIVLYIGFLIWLTLIHTQTRLIRIEPQQKFHNKTTFSSYFYISIILVFLTFFQISYVLPYCLTLALGERQSIIAEVQTQRKKANMTVNISSVRWQIRARFLNIVFRLIFLNNTQIEPSTRPIFSNALATLV